ncbi:MAG: choice-of-anchor D domain-containing protein, partial [Bacteroidetes bacterium]|nr:choice-of-anchor D domain-containing protein [Bacteroidota bacterium]
MPVFQIVRRTWTLLLVLLLGASFSVQTASGQQAIEVSVTVDGVSKVQQNLVDFGQVVAGESLTGTVTLTNPPDNTSDVVIDFAVIEGEISDFSVEIVPSGGVRLAPGESYFSDVTFSPSFLGVQEDILRYDGFFVQTEDSFEIFFDLIGEGVIDLQASPFQPIVVGESQTRTFILTNTSLEPGDDVLIDLAEVEGGSDFTVEPIPDGGILLAPGEEYLSDVTFSPTQVGTLNDILRYEYVILDTETRTQIFFDLTGEGVEPQNPILDVSPLQIDFPDTDVGQTAVAPVTITNLGNA